jgi:hypothetical protein
MCNAISNFLRKSAKKKSDSFVTTTNLLRLDDESLLEQPLPDEKEFLLELGNPESVAFEAG